MTNMENMSMSEIKNLIDVTFYNSLIQFVLIFMFERSLIVFEHIIRKVDRDVYNHKCLGLASKRVSILVLLIILMAIRTSCFVLFDSISDSKTAVEILEATYIVTGIILVLDEIYLYIKCVKSSFVDLTILFKFRNAEKSNKY